jgi:HD superfamily phosphohydrolase
MLNKKKIFNDPLYGFITLSHDFIFDLVEHPYFQRLRRIKQLGLTSLVYPGALHTRFHHALGAMHLTTQAIDVIRSKGHSITEKEALAVKIAILLHDIGHGPFSHALEGSLVHNVHHEDLSKLFMQRLNEQYKGKLDLAIQIFEDKYKKRFLHQLVSSQLDMDRLDYLTRDSFYTGVSEGVVGFDRIISMLNVYNDDLVVDAKAIYSLEKFIVARRIMYWQVYLHKTALAAEHLLVHILKRAKELAIEGKELFGTPVLKEFLYNKYDKKAFLKQPGLLDKFALLDDYDLTASIKVWMNHEDKVLAELCKRLINRRLYKILIQEKPFSANEIKKYQSNAVKTGIDKKQIDYFVFTGNIQNNAYNPKKDKINMLFKNDEIKDVAEAADLLNISALSEPVKKYFLCYVE